MKNFNNEVQCLALDSCSPNWSSFCCSGVLSGSVEAISSLIFPISVCTPVATTTPMALPAAMLVPWLKVNEWDDSFWLLASVHHHTKLFSKCFLAKSNLTFLFLNLEPEVFCTLL